MNSLWEILVLLFVYYLVRFQSALPWFTIAHSYNNAKEERGVQLLTVIPMFWLGYAGIPRRVLDHPSVFGGWHSIITADPMLSAAGLIYPFMMIFNSPRQSKSINRTTRGIIRYNTSLNFYFYEASRISFAQQTGSYQYRYFRPTSFKLNGSHYTNYGYLETTLYSYALHKRK